MIYADGRIDFGINSIWDIEVFNVRKKMQSRIRFPLVLILTLILILPVFSSALTSNAALPIWSDRIGEYRVLVDCSDDGKYVVAGSDSGVLRMYTDLGKIIWTYTSIGTSFSSVSVSGDGQIVTANSLVFDNGGNLLTNINNSGSLVRTAVSRNGETIVSSGTNGLNIFDPEGNILGKDVEPGAIWDVAVSGDGMYGAAPVDLGWQTRKGKIVVIDRNGSKVVDYPTMSQGVGVAISRNGSSIIGIDDYNLYSLFRNGTLRWSFASSPPFRDVAITPDGRYIVAGSQYYLRFFNETGSLLWQNQDAGYVYSVAISEDGNYIIAGSADQIRLFDKSGNLLWRYDHGASQVAASKDGNYFVAGSSTEIKFFNRFGTTNFVEPAITDVIVEPSVETIRLKPTAKSASLLGNLPVIALCFVVICTASRRKL